MKKFIYTFILVVASILSFSSCTDEEVRPQTDGSTAGQHEKE
jgi:hypothetical protein